MVAMLEGKPVVELYRTVSDIKQPYRFASPVSTVTLDYVAPANGARAVLRPIPTGYCAEVSLPWKLIGLSPAGVATSRESPGTPRLHSQTTGAILPMVSTGCSGYRYSMPSAVKYIKPSSSPSGTCQ